MVEVGTGTAGTRFVDTDYPNTEGLTLGTTKLSEKPNLEVQEEDLTQHWGSI